MVTKPDILQMIDCIINRTKKDGDGAKWLPGLDDARNFINDMYHKNKGLMDDAQRDYRQTNYRYTRFSRHMTHTSGLPIDNWISKLSLSARGILFTLENYATTQYIQISTSALAELTGASKPTVLKAMTEIVNLGILKIVDPGTRRAAPIYQWSPLIVQTGKVGEWNKSPRELIESETLIDETDDSVTLQLTKVQQARLLTADEPRFVPGKAQKKMPDGTSITFTVIVSATDGDGNPEI